MRLNQLTKSDIGTSTMSMWEIGARRPKLEAFPALGILYNAPAGWLAALDNGLNAADYFFPPTDPTAAGMQNYSSIADNAVAFRASFLNDCSINLQNLILLRMPDDSMPGEVVKGGRVLVDTDQRQIRQRDMFAILDDGQVWVRWIRPEIGQGFSIASSDPIKFPDVRYTAEELEKIQIIGRVVMIINGR